MPTLRVSDDTMRLLRCLRAATELSDGKKYSLDAALYKALDGMALPVSGAGAEQHRRPSGPYGRKQS